MRHAIDVAREKQADSLGVTHELRPAELEPELLARVKAPLASGGKGGNCVDLARRVMPADPSLPTYVLGLVTNWACFRSHGPAVVGRLAKLERPMHLFIITTDGQYKALKSKLRAVPGSELS